MALGLSSTLSFCVVVNVPFLTIQVWGRFTASHFRQSDGQTMDRKKSPLSQGLASLVLSRSTHCSANLTWCLDSLLHSVLQLPNARGQILQVFLQFDDPAGATHGHELIRQGLCRGGLVPHGRRLSQDCDNESASCA